jgi:hypothetical protein
MVSTLTEDNELLDLFTRYNNDLWPVHVLAYALAVAAVALVFVGSRVWADRLISGALAVLWVWLGVVFQGLYATDIDQTLGLVYAALFVLEAYLLFRHGVLSRRLAFRPRNGLVGVFAWLALGYAVVVYPVIGAVLGHGWPESPLLGMAPCPTTIATFGLLLLAMPAVPKSLFVVPFLWAVLAPPAAMGGGVYEDAGLLLAGVVTFAALALSGRCRSATAEVPRGARAAHGSRIDRGTGKSDVAASSSTTVARHGAGAASTKVGIKP